MNAAKVLVVEDEDIVASDIIESLTEFGYEIVGRASSFDGAVELCREESPDIILMDIKLEGERDGVDAAARIGGFNPGCPIVYLTAFTDEATLERAKITEPYGYLVKPYKEIDLRTTIEIALQKASAAKRSRQGAEGQGPTRALTVRDREVNDEALTFMSRVSTFKGVKAEDLKYLAAFSTIREHSAGEFVMLEGDTEENGFIVMKGRVAYLKSSANGRDLIVELLPPADPLGLLISLNKIPYPYSTRAQVDSRLLWVDRRALFELLEVYPELSREFIWEAFKRLRKSHDFSQLLAHEKVEVRIAAALSTLIPHVAQNEGDTAVVRMTRQELAELTGTTQETCIRVTKNMEKLGILDLTENKAIRIKNPFGLEQMTTSAAAAAA